MRAEDVRRSPLPRRAVGEADRDGLPGRAEERAHQPVQHADGQFGGLAAPGLRQVEPDVDRRGGVCLGEVDVQGFVVQVLVAGEDLQCTAYVRLLADDQAEWPEVGKAAELGEADAEVLAPGRGRRPLEQLRDLFAGLERACGYDDRHCAAAGGRCPLQPFSTAAPHADHRLGGGRGGRRRRAPRRRSDRDRCRSSGIVAFRSSSVPQLSSRRASPVARPGTTPP